MKKQNPNQPRRIGRRKAPAVAIEVISDILRQLPPLLRKRAQSVAVTCAWKPSQNIISQGIESDSMGVFSGPTFKDEISPSELHSPQIQLFLCNILLEARGDLEAFRSEVRRTYLHELGHYLGLDEKDLEIRNLD